MSTINNKQVGGDHYKKNKIQPWDIIDEYNLNFYEGNVLKYLLRSKGSREEDLQKAIHYLEKEVLRNKQYDKKDNINTIDIRNAAKATLNARNIPAAPTPSDTNNHCTCK